MNVCLPGIIIGSQSRCAYKHQRISNSQVEYNNTVHEDVKKLKVEVDHLKNTNNKKDERLRESVKKIIL